MRGRAQPVDQPVLTPDGFRPIGDLRVGDLVVGSDGRPTPVLGVFPQGRKEVFRVATQDGASTLACAEHLWFVTTPDDRKHGKPGRVVETRDMIGRLRARAPAPLRAAARRARRVPERRTVPIDPYALGLLLGDGCLTTRTTPSFTTADPELADALEAALPGHRAAPQGRRRLRAERRRWRPRRRHRRQPGHGGAARARSSRAPARRRSSCRRTTCTTAPRSGSPCCRGCSTATAGRSRQRDAPAGSSTRRARPAARRRRLPRPLARRRGLLRGPASRAGRTPGGATGRPVHHRSDAHVLDIRLPAGIEPFRLARKREAYAADGGGRPMRFIDVDRAGRARRSASASPVGRRRLALRDRRLPRHAQHAQRLASSSSTRRRTPRPSR